MIDQVPLLNDRDRRVMQWLRDRVGDAAVIAAIEALPGQRRPYVSNICKQLGLSPPQSLEVSDKDKAREHLAKIRAMLKK